MESGILPSPSLNTDWVLSTASNVHIANDHAWFVRYEPFSSHIQPLYGGDKLEAIAVGDVIIPVRKHPKRTGPDAHDLLVFYNVLHVPDAICNVIGMAAERLPFHQATFGKSGALYDEDGHRVASMRYAKPTTLPALVLSGPPYGPGACASKFREGQHYAVSVSWPPAEKDRWDQYKKWLEGDAEGDKERDAAPINKLQPAYTEEENLWLQEQFGGEKAFLQVASLEADDEEDRSFGREIMRDVRAKLLPQLKTLVQSDKNDELAMPSAVDLVRAMMSEVNSGLFDEDELQFLEAEYGGDDEFMKKHGFKYTDPDQCVDAKSLVRSLMGLSDDEDDFEFSDDDDGFPNAGSPDLFFSPSDVKFMRAEGGSTENFMLMYGLKFYKDEDVEEAKAIIRALKNA